MSYLYHDIDLSSYSLPQNECIYFCKNDDPFGELSNMYNKLPFQLGHILCKSSEALYQAFRFPDYSSIQHSVLTSSHAYVSKRYAYVYIDNTRSDWDQVKVPIMCWVTQLKLYLNYKTFIPMFLQNKTLPIVEHSRTDDFWGMKLHKGIFTGINTLGKILDFHRFNLLAIVDQMYKTPIENTITIIPPDIPNLLLLNSIPPTITVTITPDILV